MIYKLIRLALVQRLERCKLAVLQRAVVEGYDPQHVSLALSGLDAALDIINDYFDNL